MTEAPAKGREAELIAVLKSDAPRKTRRTPAASWRGSAPRIPSAPLAALLGDEKLAHMARYALEPIPDPAVDAALREASASSRAAR